MKDKKIYFKLGLLFISVVLLYNPIFCMLARSAFPKNPMRGTYTFQRACLFQGNRRIPKLTRRMISNQSNNKLSPEEIDQIAQRVLEKSKISLLEVAGWSWFNALVVGGPIIGGLYYFS